MSTIDERWNIVNTTRAFCQKVLPLVYDESLSYMELVCKLSSKLNEVIENNNNLPQYVKDLIKETVNSDEFTQIVGSVMMDTIINVKFPQEGITPAKGDGVTDDTSSIQACLDYANSQGGAVVFFPSGKYLTGTLNINTETSILGADRYNTNLVLKGGGSTPLLQGVINQSVRNICLDGNRLNQIEENYLIEGNIDMALFDNVILCDSAHCITADACNNSEFCNVLCKDIGDGVFITAAGNDNMLANINTEYAINITGNNNNWQSAQQTKIDSVKPLIYQKPRMFNRYFNYITMQHNDTEYKVMVEGENELPNFVINVTDYGIDNTGVADVSAELSDLFNNPAYGVYYLPDGAYLCNKPIDITRPIKIFGEGKITTTLNGTLFNITAENVTIEGITVDGNEQLKLAFNIENSPNICFDGVTIINTYSFTEQSTSPVENVGGIKIITSINPVIKNCTFKNIGYNTPDNTSGDLTKQCRAITINSGCNNATIENCSVISAFQGIVVAEFASTNLNANKIVTISNCYLEDIPKNGCYLLSNVEQYVVENCNFKNVSQCVVFEGHTNIMTNNRIVNSDIKGRWCGFTCSEHDIDSIIVKNNYVHFTSTNREQALIDDRFATTYKVKKCLIDGNIIVSDAVGSGILVNLLNQMDCKITNNIFTTPGKAYASIISGNSVVDGNVTVENNIFNTTTSLTQFVPDNSYALLNNVYTGNGRIRQNHVKYQNQNTFNNNGLLDLETAEAAKLIFFQTAGHPTAGTWQKGTVSISLVDGTVAVCTSAGTPGTWVEKSAQS